MTCKSQPDLGAGRGLSSYTWNQNAFYGTDINYTCKKGQAFEHIWHRSVNTKCDFQKEGDEIITWRFSDTNKLSKCIRKYNLLFVRLLSRYINNKLEKVKYNEQIQ